MTTNKPAIDILFLAAIPEDIPPLKLAEECRAIDRALQSAEFRDAFELQEHWAVQIDDLPALLMRYQPHIVHFSGHGSLSNEIILQDAEGKAQPLSANVLGRLFALLRDNIQCVVLNACYSEGQAQEIAKHINCVIGMSDAIRDDAAIQFSTAFYQALGFGRDLKTAFELGCLAIESSLNGLADHLKPQLIASLCDPATLFILGGQETPSQTKAPQPLVDTSWRNRRNPFPPAKQPAFNLIHALPLETHRSYAVS